MIPEILFVIPTYNRIDTIMKTLPVNMDICERYNVDIVVIDNCSTDNTGEEIKSIYPRLNIIINSINIGLKGSFKKIITEYCDLDKIVIILSDEDIIFESGLVQLLEKIKSDDVLYSKEIESVLYFNYINKAGKDFNFRRNKKKIITWNDIEIFSFGLISAVGFKVSSLTASNIDWETHLDARNVYPHFTLFKHKNVFTNVVGLPIAALYKEEKVSFLHSEWASKSHHFSKEAVSDYLSYHEENFDTQDARKFRRVYKNIAFIFTSQDEWKSLKMLYNFISLFILSPKFGFYYVLRKFGY
ncbi:glycosyltransferase [Sulfurimonas aquatica]|uniref:Glycosyltransferase n=1 Tax=Sulfurimonas aquatica TaxID=2672570 RepID=A0A975GD49_9BACT|nr:glycosyltransferase [Sulfurimonas aquatica]QSZ42366.1 glycosyltransferase [Sulfurimonas aquatica]